MGDLPQGGGADELKSSSPHSTSFGVANVAEIGEENWATANRAAREIIWQVQPTSLSEVRRKEVVDYIQRLIRNCLRVEVFPYGSLPLKTYLPDGDIDLTAFGTNVEDILPDEIKSLLEAEEKNTAAEFIVKDVQLILAEVKLVKCIVQDIVVDISFNQIGGLCTLCFLEQVDKLIDKDHLFKRSIILIKAWCYYESRVLGAHHGLISTYALETLVLYIFHFYHSTLDGPLAVLYKFLDYFSKFDWENYCVSLNGPIRLSSLPAILVDIPEDSDRDLLLSSDFLSYCVSMFSVPSRGGDKNPRGFQRKHLNIVDPLKETNNLGRSVSQGNFYRIRSAFSYGARKLAGILLQPQGSIANDLRKFFANALSKRPDVQDLDQSLISNRPSSALSIPETGLCKSDCVYEYSDEHAVLTGDFLSGSGKSSQDLLKGVERTLYMKNSEQHSSLVSEQPAVIQHPKVNDVGPHLHDDSNNVVTSTLGGLKISTDSSMCQTMSPKENVSVVHKPPYAPHLFFPKSKWHDYSKRDGSPDTDKPDKCENNASALASSGSDENGVIFGSISENLSVDRDEAVASSKPREVSCDKKSSPFPGDSNHVDSHEDPPGRSGTPEYLNSSNLTGDYDTYLHCLQYGRWCYEYGLGMHSLPTPPMPTMTYRCNNPWDSPLPVSHYKQNGFSHQHHNGFHPSPAVYTVQPVLLPGVPFGWEEPPKPRGTGTYFPNTNPPVQGYRSSAMKKKTQAPSRSPHNNSRNMIFTEQNMVDRSSHEASQPQVSSSDSYLPFSPRLNGYPNANGVIQPEGVVEFELASGTSMSENSMPQRAVSSSVRTLSGTHKPQNASSSEQDRSSYRLKDQDEFPPLSI